MNCRDYKPRKERQQADQGDRIDYSLLAIPKPPPRVKPERTKDGRRVLKNAAYTAFRKTMCDLAHERCEGCAKYTPLERGEVHHEHGRGMGGSKRNDDPRSAVWLCRPCHTKRHGQ